MNSTRTKVTIVSIWLNTQSLQENQENEGGGISWALAKGVETARKPLIEKEGEKGGFDASGAIIRRSNNGTKATDVVCTSI